MKQQTAVEWLEFEITKRGPHENNPPQWLIELYEQAKEMEKKDICHFGAKCCIKTTEKKSWTIEELYNETFNK
jgi:hypothetical protein